MPGLDATQVRVGSTGRALIAPVGTANPADETQVFPAGWLDLGYADEQKTLLHPELTPKDFMAWQSLLPVRSVVTKRSFDFKISLMQFTGTNLRLALGGGTVANNAGHYTWVPPVSGSVDERAFALEVTDGSLIYRWILARCLVVAVTDIAFRKDQVTTFDVTLRTLQPAAGAPTVLVQTNDTNLAA